MTEDAEASAERAAVGNASRKAGKSNAANDRREQFEAVLSEMLGRPARFPRGLGVRDVALIPRDFDDLPAHGSYKELKDKIAALEKMISSAESGIKALLRLGDLHGFPDVDNLSPVDKYEGFSLLNAARLNGLCISSTKLLFEVYKNAQTAKSRLESEKRAYFPDGRGRKRNARAYVVADKLAQFYLYNVKNRPTYGTDYGAPSTEYQRALEKIFKIIGIEADTRGPAKAACREITDDDINKVRKPFPALTV